MATVQNWIFNRFIVPSTIYKLTWKPLIQYYLGILDFLVFSKVISSRHISFHAFIFIYLTRRWRVIARLDENGRIWGGLINWTKEKTATPQWMWNNHYLYLFIHILILIQKKFQYLLKISEYLRSETSKIVFPDQVPVSPIYWGMKVVSSEHCHTWERSRICVLHSVNLLSLNFYREIYLRDINSTEWNNYLFLGFISPFHWSSFAQWRCWTTDSTWH